MCPTMKEHSLLYIFEIKHMPISQEKAQGSKALNHDTLDQSQITINQFPS